MRTEDGLKVVIEVLSIFAFLLGSPLYIQRFAEPLAPSGQRSTKCDLDLPAEEEELNAG
jgi:hypothetical protein